MSRPLKEGLDYFPHDTMAHADPKIASLMALYGTDGYAFYFILLELIFRAENGRITVGKPSEKIGLAHAMCMNLQRFEQILESAIELNCFDEAEYKERNILISNGINKRLDKINNDREKDRKRKELWKEKESTKEKELKELKEKEKEKEKAKSGKLPENCRKTHEAVVAYLNQVCGTRYKASTKETIGFIETKLKQGFTLDDFKTVIDKKYAEWGPDSKMVTFLRPETLFGTKFESYLNQPVVQHMSKSEQAMARYLRREKENEERGSDKDCIEIDSIVS